VSGQPVESGDCALVQTDQSGWLAASCAETHAYVCESPPPAGYIPLPKDGLCDLYPARFCQPEQKDAPDCQPASALLPATRHETYQQIEACQNAFLSGACSESDPHNCPACVGAAAVPAAGSTCPAFEPEEQGFCGLQQLITNGCTPGEHCCSVLEAEPLPLRTVDADAGGVTYVDDAFRGTAQPTDATGHRSASTTT
jgi:hypothetical protein